MSPDDVYVPMAARIKMFEKGLGNGSNKAPPSRPTATASTKNSRSNESPPKTTPSNHSTTTITATTSTPTVAARSKSTQSSTNTSVPSYARETIATLRRSNSHHKEDQSSQESQSKPKKEQRHIEVKPFRFATDARSQHRQAAFNEKLKIWKQKENEQKKQQVEPKRGTKRKLENEQEQTSNKRR
ncbi:hypothetical protein RMCBS344292_17040 [Rhizopus microsporus]|nr:hypothetical protein RMCBS344292_17040 [Rhizopus microsporus]